jgi:hypothetical protein
LSSGHGYLLNDECILQFVLDRRGKVFDWVKDKPSMMIAVSVLSVGQALNAVEEMAWSGGIQFSPLDKEGAKREIIAFMNTAASRNSLIDVDKSVVPFWAQIRLDEKLINSHNKRLAQDDVLVIATALAKGLILVEPGSKGYSTLSTAGLKVFDPETGTMH